MQKIKDYLSRNNIDSAIRVTLMEGGCSGPALGIVLDKATGDDRLFASEGVDFIIHESLLTDCGSVKIDFIEPDGSDCGCGCGGGGGFEITSERPVAPTCGCSCGSGSCG